jgi:hypothetical protein
MNRKEMTALGKNDQKPFAFWLVEAFLSPEDEAEEPEVMGDREYFFGLLLGLAIVVAAGVLIRG